MKFVLEPGDICVRKGGGYVLLLADNSILIAIKGQNDDCYKPRILAAEEGLFPAEPGNVRHLTPEVKAIFLTARLIMGRADNQDLEANAQVMRK